MDGFILQVTIGVSSSDYLASGASRVWFERDWTPWVPTADETLPWDFELSRPTVQPAKRRKVKDGKTQQLYQFFDGLV